MQKNTLNVFVDTDVFFDVISGRKPFFEASAYLFNLAMLNKILISTSEISITNLIYLSIELNKIPGAKNKIYKIVNTCDKILACGKKGILQSLDSEFKDKEDAVQYYTALNNDMDYFVTRNIIDYKKAVEALPVVTPQQFSEIIEPK